MSQEAISGHRTSHPIYVVLFCYWRASGVPGTLTAETGPSYRGHLKSCNRIKGLSRKNLLCQGPKSLEGSLSAPSISLALLAYYKNVGSRQSLRCGLPFSSFGRVNRCSAIGNESSTCIKQK